MAASRRSNRPSPGGANARAGSAAAGSGPRPADGAAAADAAARHRSARRTERARSLQVAALIEQSNDAIVRYAPDGTITGWNPGAERLYGFSAAEVIGRHPDDFPPASGEFMRLLRRAADGEPVVNHETIHLTKSGERLVVALTV